MRVSSLIKVTEKKQKVVLEDGRSFVLYLGEIRKYQIREGEELPEERFHQIREEVLSKRAKLRSLNLLKNRDYSVEKLKERLARDGYPPDVITEAAAYVTSFHYLDDARLAETYIRQNIGRKSRRQIEYDLRKRGVSEEDIQKGLETYEAEMEGSGEDLSELPAILRLIEKRHYDPEEATNEETQKLMAALMRKGFGLGEIKKALKELRDGISE